MVPGGRLSVHGLEILGIEDFVLSIMAGGFQLPDRLTAANPPIILVWTPLFCRKLRGVTLTPL